MIGSPKIYFMNRRVVLVPVTIAFMVLSMQSKVEIHLTHYVLKYP
uniref:Uncharacterized protein n=1 Tax=Triticum urartu TaxID=4572 RepID=A0A8R7TUW2_TRIUA